MNGKGSYEICEPNFNFPNLAELIKNAQSSSSVEELIAIISGAKEPKKEEQKPEEQASKGTIYEDLGER